MAATEIKVDKDTGYTEFMCDYVSDLNKIPHKENLFGCAAYVLETKKVYILNSNQEWEVQ